MFTQYKKKKRIRNYEENMEDLWDTTKGPNHIFGVEEGAEIQTKVIENLFNEAIAENFPHLGKNMDIQVKEALRTPNRHNQKRIVPYHS